MKDIDEIINFFHETAAQHAAEADPKRRPPAGRRPTKARAARPQAATRRGGAKQRSLAAPPPTDREPAAARCDRRSGPRPTSGTGCAVAICPQLIRDARGDEIALTRASRLRTLYTVIRQPADDFTRSMRREHTLMKRTNQVGLVVRRRLRRSARLAGGGRSRRIVGAGGDRRSGRGGRRRRRTDYGYKFTDDPLSAGGFGPTDATIRVRPGPVRTTLIRPRTSFVPEMLKSVENL